jgi:5'-nucleotidase
MTSRRDFLQKSLLGTAAIAALGPSLVAEAASSNRLVILHSNDMHSRIEPFPDSAPQWAGLGGMARREALIASIRRQEPNVLLLDSGDIWQGTPYFNFFGGELEYKLMSSTTPAHSATTTSTTAWRACKSNCPMPASPS